ncbi:MAG: hypothetical protein HOE90_12625 [Bacteriovoracaceae bacterium]|jgi:hypothetical protein|nr:hypothetical protein [Bacteriovoracaceae bacterium]
MGFIDQISTRIAQAFNGATTQSGEDLELIHLRNMHKIQKHMGNLPPAKLEEVEQRLMEIGEKYGYSVSETSSALLWLQSGLKGDVEYWQKNLSYMLKVARTYGRVSLDTLSKEEVIYGIRVLKH